MTVEAFIDTNILAYATQKELDDNKRAIAFNLVSESQFGLSAQVLQEFYVTVIRKIRTPLAPEEAMAWLDWLDRFPCVNVDASLVRSGVTISQRYQISYWDGAIIAAAELLGAETLYTEDLNHEQIYGSVQVVNPFIG